MRYLSRRDGTLWFQIRVPNALVWRYGSMIRQCLRTSDLAIAQPIALQLAGNWLARFSAEKFDTATASAAAPPPATPAPPPDPFAQHVIPDPGTAGQQSAVTRAVRTPSGRHRRNPAECATSSTARSASCPR